MRLLSLVKEVTGFSVRRTSIQNQQIRNASDQVRQSFALTGAYRSRISMPPEMLAEGFGESPLRLYDQDIRHRFECYAAAGKPM